MPNKPVDSASPPSTKRLMKILSTLTTPWLVNRTDEPVIIIVIIDYNRVFKQTCSYVKAERSITSMFAQSNASMRVRNDVDVNNRRNLTKILRIRNVVVSSVLSRRRRHQQQRQSFSFAFGWAGSVAVLLLPGFAFSLNQQTKTRQRRFERFLEILNPVFWSEIYACKQNTSSFVIGKRSPATLI